MASRARQRRSIWPWVAAAALGCAERAHAVEGDPGAVATSPGAVVYHSVVEGDTVYSIATRYGSSVELVIEANGIDDVFMLAIGRRLRVPLLSGSRRPAAANDTARSARTHSADLERILARSEAKLREAHFETALELAESVRVALNARNVAPNDPKRVRLEVVKATAQVALGQTDAALDSLERALLADPDLELDPAVTSPKLMAVFYVARGSGPPTR